MHQRRLLSHDIYDWDLHNQIVIKHQDRLGLDYNKDPCKQHVFTPCALATGQGFSVFFKDNIRLSVQSKMELK